MNTKKQKFSDYFNAWLYSKDGYYSKYKEIGKEGDFYTSVSTSSFFGGSIGMGFSPELRQLTSGDELLAEFSVGFFQIESVFENK